MKFLTSNSNVHVHNIYKIWFQLQSKITFDIAFTFNTLIYWWFDVIIWIDKPGISILFSVQCWILENAYFFNLPIQVITTSLNPKLNMFMQCVIQRFCQVTFQFYTHFVVNEMISYASVRKWHDVKTCFSFERAFPDINISPLNTFRVFITKDIFFSFIKIYCGPLDIRPQ